MKPEAELRDCVRYSESFLHRDSFVAEAPCPDRDSSANSCRTDRGQTKASFTRFIIHLIIRNKELLDIKRVEKRCIAIIV